MTLTPDYSSAAPPRHVAAPPPAGPVLLAVPWPAAQRRATVAVRLLLAVPHLLALSVLGIAASAVAAVGWLGALATGRLPRFAAGYLTGYLRWSTRVGAYLLLLTDAYPPFTLAEADYPARLTVSPGRLNRLSVLLRGVLAIPAVIASALLSVGFTVIVIVAWLVALVAGRLPVSLHGALAAVLRYVVRCQGYLYLLTSAYPAGLFGDRPVLQPVAVPPPAGYPAAGGTPPGWVYGPPPGYGPVPASPGYGTNWLPGPPAQAAAPDLSASGQLALPPGAKRLVGLMLVLGLLAAAGGGALGGAAFAAARQRDRDIKALTAAVTRYDAAVTRHNAVVAQEVQAVIKVQNLLQVSGNANTALDDVLDDGTKKFNACATVSCFNAAAQADSDAFAAFGRSLRGTPVPSGSAAITKRLLGDNADNQRDWGEMAQAQSFDSIETIATATEKVGGHWDDDYAALGTSLSKQSADLSSQATTLNNQAVTLDQQAAALKRRAAVLNVRVSVLAATRAA
jgi:Domain of unknown function (DUF4389)